MSLSKIAQALLSVAEATGGPAQHQLERGLTLTVRFEEGQLDNCPLTTQDLNRLEISFIETASAVFHQRVNYPKPYSSFKKFTQMSWFDFKK